MVKDRLISVRKYFIGKILNLANIEYIGGHWVLLSELTTGQQLVDLGANKALFSKKMIERFGMKAVLVEANKSLCALVSHENAVVYNYAIAKNDCMLDFHISSNDEASSIIPDLQEKWEGLSPVSVQGLSWKSLLNIVGITQVVEILKVDVEGSELDLIESFTAHDLENIKQITIEFHDWLNCNLRERTISGIQKLVSSGFLPFTDAPSHDWPVEMLFVNSKCVRLTNMQRFLFKIYNFVTFVKY